jgi:hypothetical protein
LWSKRTLHWILTRPLIAKILIDSMMLHIDTLILIGRDVMVELFSRDVTGTIRGRQRGRREHRQERRDREL